MTNKIPVTYPSRTGSTEGVAQYIGKTLSDFGETVDVIPMNDVVHNSNYIAVVAGSAIRAGKCLPGPMDFLEDHKDQLNRKPVAAFPACMTPAMTKDECYRSAVSAWLDPALKIVNPVSEELFKGFPDISKIPSFVDRIKFPISILTGIWKGGDHCDWLTIKTWATNLKSQLYLVSLTINQ